MLSAVRGIRICRCGCIGRCQLARIGLSSWAKQDDTDGQFILLWIAFNAAYATDIDEKYRESEQQTFRGFLEKLAQLDKGHKRFDALVWTEFPKSIRVLLDNQYVFADFWKFQNGSLSGGDLASSLRPRIARRTWRLGSRTR